MKTFIFILLFAVIPLTVQAQIILGNQAVMPGEFGQDMRATGMAGAVDAISAGTTGIYYNPAGITLIDRYTLSGGYGFTGQANAHTARVSICDSQTNPYIAGGIGYAYTQGTASSYYGKIHSLNGAIAGIFGNNNIRGSIGFTFNYLNMTLDNNKKSSGLTFTTGLQLTINRIFHSAVVVRNLHPINKNYTPRRLEIGSGASYKFVNVDFDLIFDFDSQKSTTTNFALGAEFLISMFSIRTGFNYNRVTGHKIIAAGLGFTSKWVGFDIGYQHNLTNTKMWFLGLDLEVYLPKNL